MSFLQISAMTKRLDKRQPAVVDNVSLDIAKGEILSLLGESGSGKTTLLRLIGGFEIPDNGELTVDDQTLNSANVFCPPEKRGISTVFQDHSLFPHLTVADNIGYGLHRLTTSEKETRVQEMLALIELEDCGQRYPHQLSGGQQQRVAVARALAPQPRLLLLDEPLSSLDSILRRQIRDVIANVIRRTQTTTVWVTHDTDDAMAVSNRIAVLNQARLVQIGSPQEIYERPRTRFVAELVGRCNFLIVTQEADGLHSADGALALAPDSAATGERKLVAVRPEHIEVTARETANICGRVVECRFCGAFQELSVLLHNEEATATSLCIHHFGKGQLAIGDEVGLAIAPDNIHPIAPD